jgi:hypothetical protein
LCHATKFKCQVGPIDSHANRKGNGKWRLWDQERASVRYISYQRIMLANIPVWSPK